MSSSKRVVLLSLVLMALLGLSSSATVKAASRQAIAIQGRSTAWTVSLLWAQGMARIPHTTWRGYAVTPPFRLFVLKLGMTNTGSVSADLYDDVTLALRAQPPSPVLHPAGLTTLQRDREVDRMYATAGRTYGCAVPWQRTAPGHRTTYCYIIGGSYGESHLGLYLFVPGKGLQFLQNTGL